MKRNLLTQMTNEWKENAWLIIELAVVLSVVWGLSTSLYAQLIGLSEPKGYDPDNVHSIKAFYISSNSPDYIPVENDWETYYEDLYQLYAQLKENVNVEAIALHDNADPYNMSGRNNFLIPADGNDSIIYNANLRFATPDIIDVLGVKSLTGLTPEKLKEILRNGELLITDSRAYQELGRDPLLLKGKTVFFSCIG